MKIKETGNVTTHHIELLLADIFLTLLAFADITICSHIILHVKLEQQTFVSHYLLFMPWMNFLWKWLVRNYCNKIWDNFLSVTDGEPRFGGRHRYQPGVEGQNARAGGGAYHTATITVQGNCDVVAEVVAVAKKMGLLWMTSHMDTHWEHS